MEDIVAFLTIDRIIEISGFIIGLFYLYWEYHANSKMWYANILMPTLSFWVYYRAGLYADFAMNFYYFGIAIYGFVMWTRKKGKNDKPLQITNIPSRYYLPIVLVFIVIYTAIASWLVFFTDSTVPFLDAFTTSLSIVAMWLLARKYLQQWLAWIAVDAVTSGLCLYKDRFFYALLYLFYTVIAVYGYIHWKKLMKKDALSAVPLAD